MAQYLLGVDLGTSSCKTVTFNLEGEKIAESTREYPIYHPYPRWAEQKPSDWWQAAVETIRYNVKNANLSRDDIAGLAVTSQREAVVPINRDGTEIYNSIIWLDNRTGPQTEEIRNLIPQKEVLSITGSGIDPIFSASKILWLKENVPEVYDKTAYFLCAKDYIIFKLSDEKVTDNTMASRTMLFDIKTRKWSEKLSSVLNIPITKLPNTKESSAMVGEVTNESSKITGLPKGLPIINGGGDRPCECLGGGVTMPGEANIGTGTGSVIEVPLSEPKIDMKGRLSCCCHVIPDTWEYEPIIATTGASFRWFRDIFGHEEKAESAINNRDPYEILVEKASKVDIGSEGLFFYPYLTGAWSPKFNEKARGVFFGINLSHRKGHFIRAILEGVAFQYLETFELLNDLGVNINQVNMVGGETKSDLWNQIKADVLGRTTRLPKVDDAAALGAAMLAGVGTQHYSSLSQAAKNIVEIHKIFDPNPTNHKFYAKIFKDYRKVYSLIEKGYEVY